MFQMKRDAAAFEVKKVSHQPASLTLRYPKSLAGIRTHTNTLTVFLSGPSCCLCANSFLIVSWLGWCSSYCVQTWTTCSKMKLQGFPEKSEPDGNSEALSFTVSRAARPILGHRRWCQADVFEEFKQIIKKKKTHWLIFNSTRCWRESASGEIWVLNYNQRADFKRFYQMILVVAMGTLAGRRGTPKIKQTHWSEIKTFFAE